MNRTRSSVACAVLHLLTTNVMGRDTCTHTTARHARHGTHVRKYPSPAYLIRTAPRTPHTHLAGLVDGGDGVGLVQVVEVGVDDARQDLHQLAAVGARGALGPGDEALGEDELLLEGQQLGDEDVARPRGVPGLKQGGEVGVSGAAREAGGRWRTFLTMVVASTVPRCIACVHQLIREGAGACASRRPNAPA